MLLTAATCHKCKKYTMADDLETRDINGHWICKKCFKKLNKLQSLSEKKEV